MKIACPHCRADFAVPDEVMRRGVARVACESCSFSFVIRLGDPGSAKPREEAPIVIEGLKSSGKAAFAAGEIGQQRSRFIAAETRTLVVLDPELREEIEKVGPLEIAPSRPSPRDPTEPDTGATPTRPDLPSVGAASPGKATSDAPPPAPPAPAPASSPPEAQPALTFEAGPADEPTERLPVQPANEPTERLPVQPPAGEGFEAFRPVGAPVAPPPGAEVPPTPSPAQLAAAGLIPVPVAAAAPAAAPVAVAPMAAPFAPPPPFASLPPEPPAVAPPAAPFASLPPEPRAAPPAGYAPSPFAGGPPAAAAQPMPYPPAYPAAAYPPAAYPPASYPPAAYAPGYGYQPGFGPPEDVAIPEPRPSRAGRVIGMMMSLIVGLSVLFFLFLLVRNDWSLDFANFGRMIDRAFGRASKQVGRQELRGLDASEPIVEQGRLASGEVVVTAKGAVKNNDTRVRRYVYVRARLRDKRGRDVLTAEVPAGNIFSLDELRGLSKRDLDGRINPGGRDGRNQKVEPGQSLAYMVVLVGPPPDYSAGRYDVAAEVSQAELYVPE